MPLERLPAPSTSTVVGASHADSMIRLLVSLVALLACAAAACCLLYYLSRCLLKGFTSGLASVADWLVA